MSEPLNIGKIKGHAILTQCINAHLYNVGDYYNKKNVAFELYEIRDDGQVILRNNLIGKKVVTADGKVEVVRKAELLCPSNFNKLFLVKTVSYHRSTSIVKYYYELTAKMYKNCNFAI